MVTMAYVCSVNTNTRHICWETIFDNLTALKLRGIKNSYFVNKKVSPFFKGGYHDSIKRLIFKKCNIIMAVV